MESEYEWKSWRSFYTYARLTEKGLHMEPTITTARPGTFSFPPNIYEVINKIRYLTFIAMIFLEPLSTEGKAMAKR